MKAIPLLIFIKTTVERLCIYIHLEKAESKAQKHDQMCRENCITQKQLCIKKRNFRLYPFSRCSTFFFSKNTF
jgi:hypothetical protein